MPRIRSSIVCSYMPTIYLDCVLRLPTVKVTTLYIQILVNIIGGVYERACTSTVEIMNAYLLGLNSLYQFTFVLSNTGLVLLHQSYMPQYEKYR